MKPVDRRSAQIDHPALELNDVPRVRQGVQPLDFMPAQPVNSWSTFQSRVSRGRSPLCEPRSAACPAAEMALSGRVSREVIDRRSRPGETALKLGMLLFQRGEKLGYRDLQCTAQGEHSGQGGAALATF